MTTKIVAIIGPPSSGKTTLICQLKKRGFKIIPEQARKYIPLFDMEKDRLSFQKRILEEHVKLEKKSNGLAFSDTGRFCNIAYLKYYGLPVPGEFNQHMDFRYHMVFEAEALPFEEDGIRNERDTERISRLIREEYLKRGMKPIMVKGTTEERADQIEFHLSL